MANKKTETSQREITANEFTDVRDIKNNLLYTKSGYIFGYLRLFPINIYLLSEKEKENICNTLTGSFKGEKLSFSILVIPRTVDMEIYLTSLSNRYDEEITNPIKKMLLSVMIKEASEKVMDGKNFEHQFYLSIWSKYNPNVAGIETSIKERLHDFEMRYRNVQNETKILDDLEIIKLCNLFANSNTAIFENVDQNINYVPITNIKGVER